MSGSNSRQTRGSLPWFQQQGSRALDNIAGKSKLNRAHRRASNVRIQNSRKLLLEGLERRELMAADTTAAYYNPLIATDVSGDFNVTPLDALQVINALSSQSRSGVSLGTGTPTAATSVQVGPMVDVNRDGYVTALDALMVINKLNVAEGLDNPLVIVKPQIYSSAGVLQTPDASGNFTLAAGDNFTLRVQAQDNRGATAQGIFAAVVDINYSTVNSPDTELAQVQWGEYQVLSFSNNLKGGSFTLDFGGQSTGPIAVGQSSGFLSTSATVANIKAAVGALPFVGGANNVRVTSVTQGTQVNFELSFVGPRSRTDLPNPVFSATSLTSTDSNPVTTAVTTSTNPINSTVLAAAFTFPTNAVNSGSPVTYPGGGQAVERAIPGVGYKLDDAGGFSESTATPDFSDPRAALNIFDTAFRSSGPGVVTFSIDGSGSSQANILVYGSDTPIPDAQVQFPSDFQIRFVTNIQANNASANVNEDSGATNIPVTATLVTGTSYSVESVTQPAAGTGTASFLPNSKTVVYTTAANYNGPATFTYTVKSDLGDRSTATVTVAVAAVNDAPTIVQTAFSVVEDATTPLSITPAQVFSPGPLESTQLVTFGTPVLVAGQTGATVSRDSSGNVIVTPAANYFGPVLFTVTGTDNGSPAASTTTTITVTVTPVNDNPQASAPSLSVDEDSPLTITASQLFRPGPSGVGAESTQIVNLTNVTAVTTTAGTISRSSDGTSATFTPVGNFFGNFVFTAIAQDNGSPVATSAIATFTINVKPVNDAPVAVNDTAPNNFSVSNIPGVVYELDVLANDNAGPGETTDTITIVQLGALSGPGTISIRNDGKRVLYQPGSGLFNITQTFTYTIQDSGGLKSTATAGVFVAPAILPFAVSDSAIVAEGGSAITIDVLANDLANAGETKRLLGFDSPSASVGIVTLLDNGTPTNLADDKLSFVPATNFSGLVSFVYRMVDSKAGSAQSTGTVNVTVTEVNDAPTVVNQRVTNGIEDTPLTVSSATLLAGSSPGPNESNQILSITAASVTTPNAGTASIVNGNVLYTPAPNFNGEVLLSFTATDSGTPPLSASAVLTIVVAAVNDAPIANGISATTAEGVPLTITGANVVINDRAGPTTAGDELQSQSVSLTEVFMADSSSNSVSLVNGNLVFVPAPFFNGKAVIGYRIADTFSPPATAEGRVTITVTEVNQAPIPVNATRDGFASLPLTINLANELVQASRGAPNESAQKLKITSVIPSNNMPGTVSLVNETTLTYTAPAGFSGPVTFTYVVQDNGTTNGANDFKTGTATVTVNVAPFQPSRVHGTVWIDDDYDGTIDGNEQRLGGIEVVLTGRSIGATSDISPITVHTLSNGEYSFNTLPPGAYTVTYVAPAMMIDAPGANIVSRSIVAPGGANLEINFASYGIDSQYSSIIESLASSYYGTYPNIKHKGVVGLVKADGTSAWTSRRDGATGDYASAVFTEIVLANSGREAYLTTVNAAGERQTALVPRTKLALAPDGHGNTLVYVLARPNELSFAPVPNSSLAPQVLARGYLQAVDRAIAEYDFL